MVDVVLPDLPALGSNPWYEARNAFDEAVKQQLEGPLSESALETLIDGKTDPLDARVSDLELAEGTPFSDEAVQNLFTGSSLTRSATDGRYPVYRVWNGTSYPARAAGATNIFFGPTNPGGAMTSSDFWANSNVVTMAAVAAALVDTGSDVRKAVEEPSIYIPASAIQPENPDVILRGTRGSSPNQRFIWTLPNSGVSRLFGGVRLPETWNKVKFRPHFQHIQASPTAGDVAWFASITSGPHTAGVGDTFYVPTGATDVDTFGDSSTLTLPSGRFASFAISRNASISGDTFEYPVQFLGVELVKVP